MPLWRLFLRWVSSLVCPPRAPRELGLYTGPDPAPKAAAKPKSAPKAKALATDANISESNITTPELTPEVGQSPRRPRRRITREDSVGLPGEQ